MSDSLIHLTPDTATFATIQPIDRLVGEVAAYLGGETDPLARSKAISFLDRSADRLNAFGTFLFTRKEVVYGIGDLSDGDTTVSIPADFGWPIDPVFTRKATTEVKTRTLQWVGYHGFKNTMATGDKTDPGSRGIPQFITYKSEYDENFEFWPPVDTAKFDELVINYLAPIDRPSEVTDQEAVWLLAPTREVMLTGAIALMMQFRHRAQPNIWRPFMDDFERWLSKARAAAYRRQTAEHTAAEPGELPFIATGLRSRILLIGGNT
jgi:hypothetical protein